MNTCFIIKTILFNLVLSVLVVSLITLINHHFDCNFQISYTIYNYGPVQSSAVIIQRGEVNVLKHFSKI